MTDFAALQAKIRSMANVQYAFVDVWNCRAVLAWTVFSEDGNSSHVERLTDEEQRRLNITEDVLYDAIEEAGGSISMSGHYPISDEIRAKLEAHVPT